MEGDGPADPYDFDYVKKKKKSMKRKEKLMKLKAPSLTVEERMAAILKRTGSSTLVEKDNDNDYAVSSITKSKEDKTLFNDDHKENDDMGSIRETEVTRHESMERNTDTTFRVDPDLLEKSQSLDHSSSRYDNDDDGEGDEVSYSPVISEFTRMKSLFEMPVEEVKTATDTATDTIAAEPLLSAAYSSDSDHGYDDDFEVDSTHYSSPGRNDTSTADLPEIDSKAEEEEEEDYQEEKEDAAKEETEEDEFSTQEYEHYESSTASQDETVLELPPQLYDNEEETRSQDDKEDDSLEINTTTVNENQSKSSEEDDDGMSSKKDDTFDTAVVSVHSSPSRNEDECDENEEEIQNVHDKSKHKVLMAAENDVVSRIDPYVAETTTALQWPTSPHPLPPPDDEEMTMPMSPPPPPPPYTDPKKKINSSTRTTHDRPVFSNDLAAKFAQLQKEVSTLKSRNALKIKSSVEKDYPLTKQRRIQQSSDETITTADQRLRIYPGRQEAMREEWLYEIEEYKSQVNNLQHEKDALEEDLQTCRGELRELKSRKQIESEMITNSEDTTNTTSTNTMVQLKKKDLDELQKEIQDQEIIITGYQKENEMLMEKVQVFQTTSKRADASLLEENQSLNRKMNELRNQLHANDDSYLPTSPRDNSSMHALMHARLQAESKADAALLELNDIKKDRHMRESELQQELLLVRKAKREIECDLSHVDKRMLNDIEHEDLLEKLTNEKQQAISSSIALQSKLDWYIRNQKMIDAQDSLIESLRSEVDSYREEDGHIKNKSRRNSKDTKRIQDLEKDVLELEEIIKTRNPDSITSLIRATKPSLQETREEKSWKNKAISLKKEIGILEKASELKLSALRQEHDKIIQRYEDQKSTLTLSSSLFIEKQLLEKERQSMIDTIQDMEKKHLHKIKSLQQKGWEKKDITKENTSTCEVDRLEKALRISRMKMTEQEKELVSLRDRVASHAVPSTTIVSSTGPELKLQMDQLRLQLRSSEEARELLVDTMQDQVVATSSSSSRKETVSSSSHNFASLEEKLHLLLTELRETRSAHTTQVEDYKSQACMYRDQVENLRTDLREACKDGNQWKEIASRVPYLEEEVLMLRKEANVPKTPSMLQYQTITQKVDVLTSKLVRREKELQHDITQTQRTAQAEKYKMSKEHEAILVAKNVEINSFRTQLDSMLQALDTMREVPKRSISNNQTLDK